VLDESAAAELDRQSGTRKSGSRAAGEYRRLGGHGRYNEWEAGPMPAVEGDSGGASRFFYVAKASRAERNAGLDGFEETIVHEDKWATKDRRSGTPRNPRPRDPQPVANSHPTVKPLALMRWLVRLVTPPDGMVLDPFTGSGTTGCACAVEGFDFIGIEREAEYVAIAEARIAHWAGQQRELAA
jgi:site-specific DNA-methyltransferase (adenine-specific)